MLSETSDISGQRAANTVKLCKVNSHETSTNITQVGRLTLILFMTLHNLQITQYSHFTVVSSSSTTSQILRRYSEQALPSFDLDHPGPRVNCQQTQSSVRYLACRPLQHQCGACVTFEGFLTSTSAHMLL